MRVCLQLAAAAILSAASAPPAPADLERFDRAIEAGRFDDAAAVFDKLVVERTPTDGQPRPDSLLNAMLGRMYLTGNRPGAAATQLAAVRLAELPTSFRAKTALDYALALEWRGGRSAALAAYRDALAASSEPADQRRAALGIARISLVSDPLGARQYILGIANGPPSAEQWEAHYLLAQSASLLGDAAAAARFADEAWNDAASAPPRALATLQVATLRAGLAAARRDRAAEHAMLAVVNGLGVAASASLGTQLPVCGDNGVMPSDFVIFGIVDGSYGTRRLVPIAASRLQVVAPFFDRLTSFSLIKTEEDRPNTGTVVTVSCRTAVNRDSADLESFEDPLLAWFVERGLYPASASSDPSDTGINTVRTRIDALQARFGAESELLIEPRWQLLSQLELRAGAGAPVLPGQLSDLRVQVAAGMRRAGAPLWLAESFESRGEHERLVASASNPAEILAAIENFAGQRLRSMPFPVARRYLRQLIQSFSDDLPVSAARLVIELDKRAPKTLARRDRQAWLLNVAWAYSSLGKLADSRAALAAAGLDENLCLASETSGPDLLEQQFSNEDYPPELTAGEQEGLVLVEFAVGADGQVRAPRILYAMPSGLFDALSLTGISTARYTPAKRGEKPYACRGQLQTVVWRLEGGSDVTTPTLSPEDLGDIS